MSLGDQSDHREVDHIDYIHTAQEGSGDESLSCASAGRTAGGDWHQVLLLSLTRLPMDWTCALLCTMVHAGFLYPQDQTLTLFALSLTTMHPELCSIAYKIIHATCRQWICSN